jgi:hypothetical protein
VAAGDREKAFRHECVQALSRLGSRNHIRVPRPIIPNARGLYRRLADLRRAPGRLTERLVAILDHARINDDAPVEVFALDALARIAADAGDIATARDLCEAADRRMKAASHFITDFDRTDAHSVRQIA